MMLSEKLKYNAPCCEKNQFQETTKKNQLRFVNSLYHIPVESYQTRFDSQNHVTDQFRQNGIGI